MDFPAEFLAEILRYQKQPSSRTKDRRIDLEIFSGLFIEVTKVMRLEVFLKKLNDCKTDDEKIDLIKPYFKWTPDSSSWPKFKKSSTKCLDFCEKTMEAGSMTQCMEIINKMFTFAEDEGDRALANLVKYSVLYQGQDYSGALEAIKNVVKSPVPPKNHFPFLSFSRDEAIFMQTSCEKKVREQANQNTIKKGAYKKEMYERKEFMRNLFTLKNPNPVAPSLEDFVEIKYNSSRGRYLIVNKDVPMGTTVLVEKPAVAAPFQESLNLGVVHCHHCFNKNFNLVPCQGCVFAWFCDEKCMKEAENYHQFECPAFPDLHSIIMGLYADFVSAGSNLPGNWITVFKLISSVGPNRLFQIFQQEKNSKNVQDKSKESNEIAGLDPVTKIYDPDSYETICHLYRDFDRGSLLPSVAALCLGKILETKSNFFDKLDSDFDVDSKTKLEFQDFLTKRMLSHFESFRCNSFALDEIDSFNGIRLQDTKRAKNPVELPEIGIQPLGTVIYPTASLFSHSCYPNVDRYNGLTHGLGAFITSRPLKKGEELLFSYAPHYSRDGKEERQDRLDYYNFKCDCVACTEDWPTTEEQTMKMMAQLQLKPFCPPFCCSRCYDDLKSKGEGNAIAEMKKRKMDWSKISLTPENGFTCANCNKKYSQKSLVAEYNGHETKQKNAVSLLNQNKPLEAIDILKKANEFYDMTIIPPSKCVSGQECLQKAILNIIHFSPEY